MQLVGLVILLLFVQCSGNGKAIEKLMKEAEEQGGAYGEVYHPNGLALTPPTIIQTGKDSFKINFDGNAQEAFVKDSQGANIYYEAGANELRFNTLAANQLTPYVSSGIHGVWKGPPRDTWASLVSDYESRPQPPLEDPRETYVESHTAVVRQTSYNLANVSCLDHPSQQAPEHFIEAVWVKDPAGNIVWFEDVSKIAGQPMVQFPVDDLMTSLVPYLWCNKHGFYQGIQKLIVPAQYWNATQYDEQCGSLACDSGDFPGLSKLFEENRQANLKVIKKQLVITATFPLGSYIAIGLNDEYRMKDGTAFVLRGIAADDIRCESYTLNSQDDGGQNRDKSNKGSLSSATVTNTIATATCTVEVTSQDSNKVVLFSYGDLDDAGEILKHDSKGAFKIGTANGAQTITVSSIAEFASRYALDCNDSGELLLDVQGASEYRLTHGILMYIIWAVNITVGVFVARYEKHTKWWLGIHRFVQILNTLLTIPAYFVATLMVETHLNSPHARLGFALGFFSFFQVATGTIMYKISKVSSNSVNWILAHPKCPQELKYAVAQDLEDTKLTHVRIFTYLKNTDKAPENTNIFKVLHNQIEDKESFAKRGNSLIVSRRMDGGSRFGHAARFGITRDLVLESEKSDNKFDLKVSIAEYIAAHGCYDRLFLKFFVELKEPYITPSHKWTGRFLLVLTYIQISLGVALSDMSDEVRWLLKGWAIFLGLVFLYKEIEMHLGLPYNFMDKLFLCFRKLAGKQESPISNFSAAFLKNKDKFRESQGSFKNYVKNQEKKKKHKQRVPVNNKLGVQPLGDDLPL